MSGLPPPRPDGMTVKLINGQTFRAFQIAMVFSSGGLSHLSFVYFEDGEEKHWTGPIALLKSIETDGS